MAPPPTIPVWISTLSALLTPAIAILGGVIAYRQWRTARDILKFDLFDRALRYIGRRGILSPQSLVAAK
jgi:hypothetical protein